MISIAYRAMFFLGCMIVVSIPVYAKDSVSFETDDQKLSYSLGYQTGSSFKDVQYMKLDADIFLRGISDRLKDQTSVMSDDEMKKAVASYQHRVMVLQEEQTKVLAEKNKKESDAFLKANKAKKGIVTLPSGLQYEVLKPGTGSIPAEDDNVVAHYRATFVDGKEFANTHNKDEPAKFSPRVVIPGWREALMHMKEGAKWRLFIPPELAYGDKGSPPLIEPGVVTIFEVELLAVKKGAITEDNAKGAVTSKPTTAKKPAKEVKKQ
jgi:FKBP-type peptidyl-prolyl cis-trans isomerase